MEETKALLRDELCKILYKMQSYDDFSCDEYQDCLCQAKKLADILIEIERDETDLEKEIIKSKVPVSRIVIDAAKIIAPLAVEAMLYVWGLSTTIKFEETGRATSKSFSAVFGSFPRLGK